MKSQACLVEKRTHLVSLAYSITLSHTHTKRIRKIPDFNYVSENLVFLSPDIQGVPKVLHTF